MNHAWYNDYLRKTQQNLKNYGSIRSHRPGTLAGGRKKGSKSKRVRTHYGIPILDVAATDMPSNECYKIVNRPIGNQALDYTGLKHTSDVILEYNCFIPTGEIYEYLPCAPYKEASGILGFKQVRGVDTIMERTGVYNWGTKVFTPYKLLLYRGRFNNDPEKDDKHRFIYLAQNKPGDPVVGDCFIRLEEVHNRMRGDKAPYVQDCQTAIQSATNNQRSLNFRCWTVGGKACYTHELELFHKLFSNVSDQNKISDHIEEFRVWAEILRKSQGDKLASKDFFGRYWDVVIPDGSMPMFTAGIRILVSEKYFYDRGYNTLSKPITQQARNDIRKQVWEAIKRVVEAPRLKFKPTLFVQNVIFYHEVAGLPDGWQGLQADEADKFNNKGWRCLEPHPGGLYSILVNCPVKNFLCSSAHDKPLWQKGYAPPEKECAEELHKFLDKCGKQKDTTTYVETKYVVAAGKAKRNPTQDRCVAKDGYSANVAMSKAYPDIYPNSAKAKQKRVAEWLHRSAFSYGGLDEGDVDSSQDAINLVLGTPDTNTVMMRYEAFVKRLAYYSNGENGDRVVVDTKIAYPAFFGRGQNWMGDNNHRYTWLAPKLNYEYQNDPTSKPVSQSYNEFYQSE